MISVDTVPPLLLQVLGSRNKISDYRVINQSTDYLVATARIQNPEQQILVKMAGPRAARPSLFARTAAMFKLIREQTSIPMPEVISMDDSCKKWPWRYLITTWLPGKTWAEIESGLSPEERRRAGAQIGEAIGQLHALTFPGFGELDAQLNLPESRSYLEALEARARLILPEPKIQAYFMHVLQRYAGLFNRTFMPRLCHEDLHKYNLLFNRGKSGWQLATILDFDKAWAGYTETDLARMSLWKMTGGDFWPAYTSTHKLDLLYTLRRPIYQLLWCLEYAAAFTAAQTPVTADHLALTQSLCRDLGMPLIRSFAPFQAAGEEILA